MSDVRTHEWVPLLVPDMPSPQELMPWLERMHSARHYSNFGPLVRLLEAKFAHQFGIGVEQLTTVANATQGLELVLQALELPTGSRILVPGFTFVATATAVVRAGYTPVLADVDLKTWLLTPEIARAACAQMNIAAVLPVATFGMPHCMGAWQDFERDTGLPVVIDAAAAYGSQWLQGFKGTLVFSLHATKSLPAGEGGLVVSSRPGLAAKVRQLSNFGINLEASSGIPVGTLACLGSNAKMSEYHAAVALASLQKWEQSAHERRMLHGTLMSEISRMDCTVSWQQQGGGGLLVAPTLLCVKLANAAARDHLERVCQQESIMTRRWYQPLLQHMGVLQQRCQLLDMPNAQALGQMLLGLPFFVNMTPEQKKRIIKVFHIALKPSLNK